MTAPIELAHVLWPLAGFAVGLALGTLHFLSLRRVAQRVVAGELLRPLLWQAARIAALAAVLAGLAILGLAPLLAALAGLHVARRSVLRQVDGPSDRSGP